LDQLDRLPEARDAYDRAWHLFTGPLQPYGDDLSWRADKALCCNNYGALLVQMGNYTQAAHYYQQAIEDYSALLAQSANTHNA